MPGNGLAVAAEAIKQPSASALGVGHRFQRREGLRRDDEKGFRRMRSRVASTKIGAVNVRDEAKRHRALAVVLERLIRHDRAEVGAADADVDDIANALAGMARHAPLRTRVEKSAIASSTA